MFLGGCVCSARLGQCRSQQREGALAQEGQYLCAFADPRFLCVFAHGAVEDMVEPVFDAPVVADEAGQAACVQPARPDGAGGDVVVDLAPAVGGLWAPLFAGGLYGDDLACMRELLPYVRRAGARVQPARDDVVPIFFPSPPCPGSPWARMRTSAPSCAAPRAGSPLPGRVPCGCGA